VPEIAYFNGAFLPRSEICVSPDDRAFLFADGVYEFVRFYDGRAFAMDYHMARLARSLRELRIEGVEVDDLPQVLERLARVNGLPDAGVYLQISRGAAPRTHAFPTGAVTPTVYAFAAPCGYPRDRQERGEAITLLPDQRWARCDIKSTALLPNILANQLAKERDVAEAVFVRDGYVTEGSHTNVFAVIDGRLHTYPDSNYVLPGVTRRIVLELAEALEIPVVLRPVSVRELLAAEEVFITSSSEEVLAVIDVDGHTIASGAPGPISQQLLQAFRARVAANAAPA
jgi:D-alanine transaminase